VNVQKFLFKIFMELFPAKFLYYILIEVVQINTKLGNAACSTLLWHLSVFDSSLVVIPFELAYIFLSV